MQTRLQAEHNLPPLRTSFIGRECELRDLEVRLRDPTCRLLTLAGPGGSGKTRLAIAVTERIQQTFAHGVYYVALAPLRSAEHILPSIVEVLSFQFYDEQSPRQQLLDYLHDKNLLLLLDNLEHLLDGVDLLVDILLAAPQVKVLVTSRETLNMPEEWVWQVSGMEVPEVLSTDVDHYGAVRLFTERARQVRHDFSLQVEADQVVRICQLVDGLPLALELAASWAQTLSCAAIASEIEKSIDFLTTRVRDVPARHRSMRAVFDHSWHLLSEDKRQILQRLTVFRGGFEREAAEQVADATLPILAALVDKSLLYRDQAGRYDFHELLRQYVRSHLDDPGETRSTRNAHSQYFLQVLERCEIDLKGRRQLEALAAIEADFENVRAAWTHAVMNKAYDQLNRALESLYLFCSMRCRPLDNAELFLLIKQQLAPGPEEAPHSVWGKALVRTGGILTIGGYRGVRQEAKQLIEGGLAIAREQHDRAEIAFCLMRLGDVTYRADGPEHCLPYYEESLTLYGDDHRFYRARIASQLSINYFIAGQTEAAVQYSQQAIEVLREIGDKIELPLALARYAAIPFVTGHFSEAEQLYREALTLQEETSERMGYALCSALLACLMSFSGDFDAAGHLAKTSAAIASEMEQVVLMPYVQNALGLVALQLHNFEDAQDIFEACLDIDMDLLIQSITRFGLAAAYCAVGKTELALPHIVDLLDYAVIIDSPLYAIMGTLVAAMEQAQGGHYESALESLAVVEQQPIYFGWLERWSPMIELKSELTSRFGVNEYAAIRKRGGARTLNDTVARLRRRLRAIIDETRESGHPSDRPDRRLIKPLSEREVEVLQLIADGSSNAEIASSLHIAVSTVKVHLRNIYGKLQVKNRNQAAARARDLHLV